MSMLCEAPMAANAPRRGRGTARCPARRRAGPTAAARGQGRALPSAAVPPPGGRARRCHVRGGGTRGCQAGRGSCWSALATQISHGTRVHRAHSWQAVTYAAFSTPTALWSSERRSPCEAEPVGAAGRRRERQSPSGSWSWSGRSSAPVRRSEKCCPRAGSWMNRFQACTANFSAVTGPILAAGAVATRGSSRNVLEPRAAGRAPASSGTLPRASGVPRAAGGGGRWASGSTRNLMFTSSLSESSLFLDGFFTACPCRPVRPGSDPADLQRGDLFKERCCHRSFSDAETLFINEVQHSVKDS